MAFIPYFASGSSKESKFSQRVEMILSYLLGYLRNMSWRKIKECIRRLYSLKIYNINSNLWVL